MAIGSTSPFRPTETVALNAETASSSVPLAGGGDAVVVTNTATSLAFVRLGSDPTVAASASDMPVLPNSRALLCANQLVTFAAGVLTSGSGTILFTRGDGSTL